MSITYFQLALGSCRKNQPTHLCAARTDTFDQLDQVLDSKRLIDQDNQMRG
jgi:hypothetical protein